MVLDRSHGYLLLLLQPLHHDPFEPFFRVLSRFARSRKKPMLLSRVVACALIS